MKGPEHKLMSHWFITNLYNQCIRFLEYSSQFTNNKWQFKRAKGHFVSLKVQQMNESSILTNSGNNCTPKTRVDGEWFSGFNINASGSMFVLDVEGGKSNTEWFFYPTTTLEYMENKDNPLAQLNSERIPNNIASYRLFGIDLISSLSNLHIEKSSVELVNISTNVGNGCLPNTPTRGSDNSDLSRKFRDQKQGTWQATLIEVSA